jgi:hypothetical protein
MSSREPKIEHVPANEMCPNSNDNMKIETDDATIYVCNNTKAVALPEDRVAGIFPRFGFPFNPIARSLAFGAVNPLGLGLGFGAVNPLALGLGFGAVNPLALGLGFGAVNPLAFTGFPLASSIFPPVAALNALRFGIL